MRNLDAWAMGTTLATTGGNYLAKEGLISISEFGVIVGILLSVIAVGASVYFKWKNHQLLKQAIAQQKDTIQETLKTAELINNESRWNK